MQKRAGHRCPRAAGALAGIVVLTMATGASAQMTEVKVGISEPVNTVLAMWMADAGGFYAAHGFIRLPESLRLVPPMRLVSGTPES